MFDPKPVRWSAVDPVANYPTYPLTNPRKSDIFMMRFWLVGFDQLKRGELATPCAERLLASGALTR
jgi:hypothetical protein